MRTITQNEMPKWNPVPLVRGMEDWESNKRDNFGQILFPPVAPEGVIVIPGVYIMPEELNGMELGSGKVRIYVTDLLGNNIIEITQQCSVRTYLGRTYLIVPHQGMPTINRQTSYVYLRFSGLENYSSAYNNRMLCSEPYQIRSVDQSPTDPVEKQGTVILRWWSESDFVVNQATENFVLPYQYFDFYFELGFDAQLSKPTYRKTQEGSERDGLFFPEKTIVSKEYHFYFNAPEYLLDALAYVHFADHVEIQQGITFLRVDNIDFNIKWEAEGDVAKVDCSFTTDTVLRK